MRSKVTAVVFGLALVALGIALTGTTLGWWGTLVLFEGWWTLFLIVPAVVSMIDQGPNAGNLILLGIGGLLLADAQRLLGDTSVWSLFFPLVIVVVGIAVLQRALVGPKLPTDAEGRPIHPGSRLSAIFTGSTAVYTGLPFTGAVTLAMFGGLDLDLRGAQITEDVVIDATTLFGGTDIIVSPGTKVELSATNIFGGSDSNAPAPVPGTPGPVVHVRSTAVFGGLDVIAK